MSFRRNLVIILTHGLRSDAVGDYAAWPVQTPHLLKLSVQGLRLVSTSCSPADPAGMLSLYTGLHARQHGQAALDETSTEMHLTDAWPRLLMEEGYHVAGAGRVGMVAPWLHESVLVEDVSKVESPTCAYLKHAAAGGFAGAIASQRRQRLRYGPFDPERVLLEPDDDVDGYIGKQAATMIEHMPAGEPWATVVSFTGPGNDLPCPSMYEGLADPAKLMHDFAPADLSRVNDRVELDYPRTLLQRLDRVQIGRIRADYLGRVSLIDHAISRMLRAVNHRPDASRTWFVLASDRGMLLGEQGIVGHRSFLGPVVETPAIITPPVTGRIPDEPLCHEGLVSNVDVAATIAALGGCELPAHTAGRSLLPLLAREETQIRASQHACLSEYGHRLMLETRRHKAIFNTDTCLPIGLYDLLNDPQEQDNLVEEAKGKDLLDALRLRLSDVLMPLRGL